MFVPIYSADSLFPYANYPTSNPHLSPYPPVSPRSVGPVLQISPEDHIDHEDESVDPLDGFAGLNTHNVLPQPLTDDLELKLAEQQFKQIANAFEKGRVCSRAQTLEYMH